MKKIHGFVLVFALVLSVVALAPSVAFAFEQRSGDAVTVDDTIADDLYAFGSSVTITGDIDGDVIAFGQSITISGDVSGDVIAAGQTVYISGAVGGTVRAAGQDVEIAGVVGDDVMLAGATLGITSEGTVGRDAVLGGGTVTLNGNVGRNVLAGAETMTIASAVGGEVTADVTNLTVSKTGSVGGNLTYYSDNQAQLSGAISGETQHHPARTEDAQGETSGSDFGTVALLAVMSWIRSFIGIAFFALLAIYALRSFASVAADKVFARPLPSIGIGFAVLALVFPVTGLVFVLGLFIGAWWIAFVLFVIVGLLALVGLVVGALAGGRWLLARLGREDVHPILSTFVGLLAIWLVGIIPFVGWLVGFAAMLLGMGAIVREIYGPSRGVARAESPTSPVRAM